MSSKHVKQQTLDEAPEPTEDQQIVQVTEIRGTNILGVKFANGEEILCLMPAKFRKTVWVKKGGYVLIEPFTEMIKKEKYKDVKLKGRVVHVLFPPHIKQYKKQGIWPSAFDGTTVQQQEKITKHEKSNEDQNEEVSSDDDYYDSEDDDLVANPNHAPIDSDSESEENWEY